MNRGLNDSCVVSVALLKSNDILTDGLSWGSWDQACVSKYEIPIQNGKAVSIQPSERPNLLTSDGYNICKDWRVEAMFVRK